MSFDVSASAYSSFMGEYSKPLSTLFVDWCEVNPGQRALDVGCGPGNLTAELVARLGVSSVAAVDPSASFAAAAEERFPELDVRLASAEHLPFVDAEFDISLAQLVVLFMSDAVAGLREMARVTKPTGMVAANVWDHAGGNGPLSTFWAAAHDLDPDAPSETWRPGTREGHLAELMAAAGLEQIESTDLTVTRHFDTFDDWWQPLTLGVGPVGDYMAQLDDAARESLRAHCAELVPATDIEVSATAWCVRGTKPGGP